MKQVLRSLKSLACPFIRSEPPRIQRPRPKSSFVRANLDPTACPQAGASAEQPAEAKPALAPASPPRAARQGAVSSRDPGTPPSGGSLRRQPRQGAVASPRRCPNPPLLGSMCRKWLKAAAWTLAFLQPPAEIKYLTVRHLLTPSRSTRLPSHPPKTVWWRHRNSNPARRGSRRTASSLSTIWRLSRFRHNCRKPLRPSG